MKKIILSVFTLFIAFSFSVSAQCTPDFSIDTPGLTPPDSLLPCIVQGVAYSETVQFKNFEQFEFGGTIVTIQNLRVDSILNAPAGITWETNKTDDTFAGGENGCLQISGTTSAAVGIYPLEIWVSADLGIGPWVPVNAADEGLGYALRVKEPGGECPGVTSGLREIKNITYFSVSPNPVSDIANISFTADKAASYNYSIYNVNGQKVSASDIAVNGGVNNITLSVSDLTAGVYFISISNGEQKVTERIIVK